VRAALQFEDGTCLAELVVPNKPVQVVNRGSALWGLYPSIVSSRISKYTYAVDLVSVGPAARPDIALTVGPFSPCAGGALRCPRARARAAPLLR